MIRAIMVFAVGIPLTAVYGLRMIWAVYRGSPNTRCICEALPRRWARILLKVAGVEVVLENADRIDPDRPQILVANHVSWFDVAALAGYLPGRYRFVAKKELERVPFFGAALAGCGHVFIDRQDRSKAVESLGVARRRLEEERPTVIMFPEGTRSPTGELQEFKKGAFVLAIQTETEIVPAAISGSRDVMRKGSYRIRPGKVVIRFGEPIPVDAYTLDDRNALTLRAREALAALQAPVGNP